MSAIEKFETSDVGPDQRMRYWNDMADKRYSGSMVDSSESNFSGKMWTWSIGDLAMLRPRTQSCKVSRQPCRSDTQRLMLHIQCRGTSVHRQGGASAVLGPGDMVLSSPHEAYSIELSDHETLAIELPFEPLSHRLANLEDNFVKPLSGNAPSVRILHDFLLSLWHQGYRRAHDANWEGEISAVFYDLTAMAVRGAGHVAEQAQISGGQTERVLSIVKARFRDPDLRSSTIAQECDISVRSVQILFAAMGTTPSAYILEQRLKHASERLIVDPEISITELAFELGFNDSGYFARCFRQRFGVAPREHRTMRLQTRSPSLQS